MILFKDIRQKTGSYLLKRKIRKLSRKKQFINMVDAQTVGIVFKLSDDAVFRAVNDYLKELTAEGKQVFVIGYIDAREIPDTWLLRKGYNFFCMKDLNLYFIPELPFVKDFLKREFDLLINLSIDRTFPVDYIFAVSKAKFKTGKFFEGYDYSDLAIDIKESRDVGYLTEQMTHYLRIIHPKVQTLEI